MSANGKIEKIISVSHGKDNSTYYHVQWFPTWEHEHSLAAVKELLLDFRKEGDVSNVSEVDPNNNEVIKSSDGVASKIFKDIEKIIDVDVRETGTYYKVQWKTTWERDANLHGYDELIKQFTKERKDEEYRVQIKQEPLSPKSFKEEVNLVVDENGLSFEFIENLSSPPCFKEEPKDLCEDDYNDHTSKKSVERDGEAGKDEDKVFVDQKVKRESVNEMGEREILSKNMSSVELVMMASGNEDAEVDVENTEVCSNSKEGSGDEISDMIEDGEISDLSSSDGSDSDSASDSDGMVNINGKRIPLSKFGNEKMFSCVVMCTKIPSRKKLRRSAKKTKKPGKSLDSRKDKKKTRKHMQRTFNCEICPRSFVRHCSLLKHVETHKVEPEICKCEICDKVFPYKSALNRHKPIHFERKPFNCDRCGKGYSRASHLKRHVRSHDEHKPFKCDQCDWRFGDNADLKVHKRRHTGEKPFECDQCHLKFSASSNLAKHKRIHTGDQPHGCEICGRRFLYKISLHKHMVVHSDKKPFTCHICDKKFSFATYLNNHVKRHKGEKNFCCDICGNTFTTKYALTKLHMRIHTGEEPYECELCGRRFRLDANYKRHLKNHPGIKPYKCGVCDKTFTGKEQLKKHGEIHDCCDE